MEKTTPLSKGRRVIVGIGALLFAASLATGVILFTMLADNARTPRSHPGMLVATLSLVLLQRVGEAGLSEQLTRLFKLSIPSGVMLVGLSLILSFTSPAGNTMGWLLGTTYSLGGGIIAVAAFTIGLAFLRSTRVRN